MEAGKRYVLMVGQTISKNRDLVMALEASGFGVVRTDDGNAGLMIASQKINKWAAVLVDQYVGDMSGDGFVELLRVAGADIPFLACVLVDNADEAAMEVRGGRIGMSVLTRPVQAGHLLEMISEF
ncbi:MAG: response regulator [Bdellovibrionales bacterium]|nr:response regulator [Bdellovibrionales bacterium]